MAIAASPRLATPADAMTMSFAATRRTAHMPMNTPGRAPTKWTLIVAPATGRLTPKRCVRCSSSGPYAETTMPMSRKPTAIDPIADGLRTIWSRRILVWINDQKPTEVGKYSGWGSDEDLHAQAGASEPTGPAMMPFLRHRATDRWWKVGLGFIWIPAIIVVITVEDWLHLSQSVTWISLGVLFVAFMAYLLFWDRRFR